MVEHVEYAYLATPDYILVDNINLETAKETCLTVEFAKRLAHLCHQRGFTCHVPYLPDLNIPLTQNGHEIYLRERDRIHQSSLMIAYLSPETLAVGIAIEIANEHEIPVIGLTKKGLDKFVLQLPSLTETINFNDPSELDQLLPVPVWYHASLYNLKVAAKEEQWTSEKFVFFRDQWDQVRATTVHAGWQRFVYQAQGQVKSKDQWKKEGKSWSSLERPLLLEDEE